jgi:rSAM/selenodomain-associated transferase 2
VTIVIPTLQAAASLPATLAACAGLPAEVLVVDGGSQDATVAVAEASGARVIRAPRGRGQQLAAGAAAATTPWLLFLHADTRPAPGWWSAVEAATADPDRAHYFRFALDDPAPQARRLERMVAWRCRRLGLPYGDQGLLISRALHDRVGGYRPIPLMEDVDLVRRIGRRRLAPLPVAALTSAERWRRDGWWRRSARNLACLSLFYVGVSPERIRRLYG